MVKINYNRINRKITTAAKTWKESSSAASARFRGAKKQLLQDFDNHEVTRELNEGADAQNLSGTLKYGNLFSFIGFYDDDKPTEPVRIALDQIELVKGQRYLRRRSGDKYSYHFKVRIPSRSEFESITPYPDTPAWREGSWLYGLERGIPGFPYYLYDDKGIIKSRSGTGIQVDNIIRNRGGGFSPTKYITLLLRDFSKNLKGR